MTAVKVSILITLLSPACFLIFTIQLYDSTWTYPKDQLASTIIYIPKDMRASLCTSDNYRGVSLFNAI